MNRYRLQPPPRLAIPAIAAIVVAVGSYALSFAGHWAWGIVAALVGILLGIFGLIWAALPERRGAILGLFAILLSVLALIPAIFAMMGRGLLS